MKGGVSFISLTMKDNKENAIIGETNSLPSFKKSFISFESSIYFMPFRLKNSKNEYD